MSYQYDQAFMPSALSLLLPTRLTAIKWHGFHLMQRTNEKLTIFAHILRFVLFSFTKKTRFRSDPIIRSKKIRIRVDPIRHQSEGVGWSNFSDRVVGLNFFRNTSFAQLFLQQDFTTSSLIIREVTKSKHKLSLLRLSSSSSD